MMMDKCIVLKGNKAKCIPIRDVKKGDKNCCWRRRDSNHSSKKT